MDGEYNKVVRMKMISYNDWLKMSEQMCYTLMIDSEATMYVDQKGVVIIYPPGNELTILQLVVFVLRNTIRWYTAFG